MLPDLFGFLVAAESEVDADDILEAFREGGLSEAAGKVAERDSRKEGAGLGVLFF